MPRTLQVGSGAPCGRDARAPGRTPGPGRTNDPAAPLRAMTDDTATRPPAPEATPMRRTQTIRLLLILLLLALALPAMPGTAPYDLVIVGGRVMDPASGMDRVANVAVRGGEVAAVGDEAFAAARTIDAHGMVVAPGFID